MASPPAIHPDPTSAAHVEEALRVLHSGDARVAEADRFLSTVRASPSAWSTCLALIQSPQTTSAALIFAARTVYIRTRGDCHGYADDAHRAAAFGLALDGLARPVTELTVAAPRLYSFGRACGFCIAMTSSAEARDAMWRAMLARLPDPVVRCNALAAVVVEIEEASTKDVEKHVMVRSFCRAKAGEVVPTAVSILQEAQLAAANGRPPVPVEQMRSAVQCIQGWQKYADKSLCMPVLLSTIREPALADDVADTLNEAVGYSWSDLHLLVQACEGLIQSFRAVEGTADACVVHHAIAEVACAMSDGNGDVVIEQEDVKAKKVTEKATELLWLCLKAQGDDAFFAAVEGWGNWLCAASIGSHANSQYMKEQVPAVTTAVVQRMRSLDFVTDLMCAEDDADREVEKACVMDFLLEASFCVGISNYVKLVLPFFEGNWNETPHGLCAALLAFSVAAEDQDVFRSTSESTGIVLDVTRRILKFIESSRSGALNGTISGPLQRAGMSAVCSFAAVVASHGSEADVYLALHCASTGLMDLGLMEKAAEFLYALCRGRPQRLRQFLPGLISSTTSGLANMSSSVASFCVRGIASIVGALPSHAERVKAMELVLGGLCQHLLWVCSERKVREDEDKVCRALHLITSGLREVNDNEVAAKIFGSVRLAVFEIAIEHCANGVVSKEVCDLLEASVLPTLMDDFSDGEADSGGDDRRERLVEGCQERQDGGRLVLAMSCTSLAAECFRRSGQHGQACWMEAVRGLAPHVIDCADSGFGSEVEGRGIACLTMALQHSVDGLQAFTGGNYDSQADMTVSYFRFVTMLLSLGEGCSPIATHADACAKIGVAALQSSDLAILRECLNWWKTLCINSHVGSLTGQLLTSAGGADAVARGMVCAARQTRCAGAVADALFALCKWVAKMAGDAEPENVLRTYLAHAFSNGTVVGINLDTSVREMVYRSCVVSVGSKRDLKKALKEFGRICALAL